MTDKKIWQPSDDFKKDSKMFEFIHNVAEKYNLKDFEYETVRQWSVLNPYAFWREVWNYCEIIYSKKYERVVVDPNKMPGAKWFTGAQLNFAENLLKRKDDHKAII